METQHQLSGGVDAVVRTASRSRTACLNAKDMPSVNIGLVVAQASPTASTPVAIGRPSATRLRRLPWSPDIVRTSLIGMPAP